jgi:hypothetical protein
LPYDRGYWQTVACDNQVSQAEGYGIRYLDRMSNESPNR